MTALDRARGWFIAPPPSTATSDWSAPPLHSGHDRAAIPPRDGQTSTDTEPPRHTDRSTTTPPASRGDAAAAPSNSTARGHDSRAIGATPFAPPSSPPGDGPGAAPSDSSAAPSRRHRRGKRPARPRPREAERLDGWQPPVAGEWSAPPAVAATVTSAAVLGRAGEVEPVAAALALALRLQTRAKAAAVAVVGAVPPEVELGSSGAAARRLAARLEAHGLEPQARGRLAWVELDPGDPQFVSAARRVTLVGAPAVLAVTSARTAAVDEALNEQDLLVIVSAEPEGPLAQLAAAGLTDIRIVAVRPLGRGPARALARAGVRSARSVRHLLITAPEEEPE